MRTRRLIPAAVWGLLCLLWGGAWPAVRLGVAHLPPFTFAGVRFLCAALLLYLVLTVQRLWPGRTRRPMLPRTTEDWQLVLLTAFFAFFVTYALQFWSMQFVSAGLAAVVFSTTPIFTMLVARAARLGERLDVRRGIGAVMGVAGVALVVRGSMSAAGWLGLLGCLGILAGAFVMATAQVAIKARGVRLDPIVLAAAQMAIGGILLAGLGLAVEGSPLRIRWSPAAIFSLAYLVIAASAMAWLLYYWLLRRASVTAMSAITLTQPPVAMLIGWRGLGETPGWTALFGTLTILSGLWLLLRAPTRPATVMAMRPLVPPR